MEEYDEKVLVLAEYLGIDPENIEEGYSWGDYTINGREEKMGKPPAWYAEQGSRLRYLLRQVDPDKETWEEWATPTEKQVERQRPPYLDARFTVYEDIEKAMTEKDLHFEDFMLHPNDLWHLVASDPENADKWHVYAIRAAFNGLGIEDRREKHYVDDGEYLVLTDDEADERAREYIEESLWAFNASFMFGMTGLSEKIFIALSQQYEDANDAILDLVRSTCGIDSLVEAAIAADGRGHFLSSYDGEENEIEYEGESYYIYRVN
jgi:hypothetical protein